MNSAAELLMQQVASRVDSDCQNAKSRLVTARTMRDVKNLAHIHVMSGFRGHPTVRHAIFAVQIAAERRMEALLADQMGKLGECETPEQFKKERAKFIANDWAFLRGQFSKVYKTAETESGKMRYLLEKKCALSSEQACTLDSSLSSSSTASFASATRPK